MHIGRLCVHLHWTPYEVYTFETTSDTGKHERLEKEVFQNNRPKAMKESKYECSGSSKILNKHETCLSVTGTI